MTISARVWRSGEKLDYSDLRKLLVLYRLWMIVEDSQKLKHRSLENSLWDQITTQNSKASIGAVIVAQNLQTRCLKAQDVTISMLKNHLLIVRQLESLFIYEMHSAFMTLEQVNCVAVSVCKRCSLSKKLPLGRDWICCLNLTSIRPEDLIPSFRCLVDCSAKLGASH